MGIVEGVKNMNINAGDTVIIHSRWHDRIAVVDKVTPSGRIKIGTTYYNEDGTERNSGKWDFYRLLEATPERLKEINEKELISKAISLARNIKTLTVQQAEEIIKLLDKSE